MTRPLGPAGRGPHPHCGATTRSGTPCELVAGWGTDHFGAGTCKFHLGSTPNHSKRAHRMLAEALAARSLADVGVTPVGNPLVALAELAADAVAWKEHMANTVAMLGDQYRFADDKGAEHLDARVALFERAMDRCQKFLSDWVRLGFEEKRQALDQEMAHLLADALRTVTDGLRLALANAGLDGGVLDVVFREELPALGRQAFLATSRMVEGGDR